MTSLSVRMRVGIQGGRKRMGRVALALKRLGVEVLLDPSVCQC